MNLDTFFNFFDAYLFSLIIILFIYLFIGVKALFKVTLIVFLIELFSRSISKKLLSFPQAEYIWYLSWALIALTMMFFIIKETKKNPNIQKITIPITILILLVIIIEILRYFERNFTDLGSVKLIYNTSSLTANWLIVIYLFAPIALLLVKSIRGRISAKH